MTPETKKVIYTILKDCVDRTFLRIADKESTNKIRKPFHEALLARDFVRLSAFERSFSTSFGQHAVEEISKVIAQGNGFEATRQKTTYVSIFRGAIDEIERICSELRSGIRKPSWNTELSHIAAHNKGTTESRRVISDLWIRKNEVEHYFSIKTVRPNLDQTETAKRDMLLLKAHNINFHTYVALYYNPDGENKADYNHSFAKKIFDTANDTSFLIGKDYWDFLGGDGTYENLLIIFEEVGQDTRKRLLPKEL